MSRTRSGLIEIERGAAGRMRSVSEWAQVRALAADDVSQREIAERLGMNRRTVKRLVEAPEPPRYRRESTGSMLDPLNPVLRQLVKDFEGVKAPRVTELLRDEYGYTGSVDLVRKRLAELRPKAVCIRSGLDLVAGLDRDVDRAAARDEARLAAAVASSSSCEVGPLFARCSLLESAHPAVDRSHMTASEQPAGRTAIRAPK